MNSRVFEHKGYTGSIDFSVEDNTLTGKILFINDLVNYEADTLMGLRQAFEEAVDFYLETCRAENLAPDRPCSGTFNVRVSQDLHRKALVEAARRGVTLNEFVSIALNNETTSKSRVTIHNHEHRHMHVAEAQLEVTASFKETTKWKHEGQDASWH